MALCCSVPTQHACSNKLNVAATGHQSVHCIRNQHAQQYNPHDQHIEIKFEPYKRKLIFFHTGPIHKDNAKINAKQNEQSRGHSGWQTKARTKPYSKLHNDERETVRKLPKTTTK